MIFVPDIVTDGDPTIHELGIGAVAEPPQAKNLAGRPLQYFYTWQIHNADGSVMTLPESNNPNISFFDLQPYALSELSVRIRISDGVTSKEVAISPDMWIEIPAGIQITTVHADIADPESLGGTSLVTPDWWREILYEIAHTEGKVCVERHPVLRHCTKENYRTIYPFSADELKRINLAMSVVAQRMLSPAVLDCAFTNSNQNEWNTLGSTIPQSSFQGVVRTQINRLLSHFPEVYIYAYNDPVMILVTRHLRMPMWGKCLRMDL
jgi:hypothetical protein